jgi:nicotinamidase-related amidase/flavin reductase (DIM6/NTAB) family NADH-FMN oxidoreductase RutF
MRLFPTGVTVLLTRTGSDVHGMTANAVCSISLEPPLVMVSLDNKTRMRQQLRDGALFSINILNSSQSPVADRFAGRHAWDLNSPEFSVESDCPVLAGCLASLICELHSETPAGDHTMILGRVIKVEVSAGGPLIFYMGRWTAFPGPNDIFLLDRSEFSAALNAQVTLSLEKAALVMIDNTRGHLDPEVATMPIPPKEASALIANSRRVLDFIRHRGKSIVHVYLEFPGASAMANPFMRAVEESGLSLIPWTHSKLSKHNVPGSVQAEIVSELAPVAGEHILNGKRRPSAFFGTGLEELLSSLQVDTVILMGVNTNTSILHTALDAFSRDYKVIVLADCVTSMYGHDLNDLALMNIEYCVGWVMSSAEFVSKVESEASAKI